MIMNKNKTSLKTLFMAAGVLTAGAISGTPLFAGDDESEKRDLSTFHTIVVKGAIDLDVRVGRKQSVHVSVEDMKLSDVKTTVKDGILYIDTLKEKSVWGGRHQSGEVNLSLSMEKFNGIKVKGAVDGDISGIDSKDMFITISGAADLNLSGSCGTLEMDVRGAGDLDAEDLKCKAVDVSISGAGDAEVYASDRIKAVVSGVGNIDILGNPKDVTKKVRGLGSIKVKS